MENIKIESETHLKEFKEENLEKISKIEEYEKVAESSKKEVESMKEEVEEMKKAVEEMEKVKSEEVQKAGAALGEKLNAEMEQWRLDEEMKKISLEKETLSDRVVKIETAEKELRDLMEEKESTLNKARDDLENMKIKCASAIDEASQKTEMLQELEAKMAASERSITERLEEIASLKEEKRALSQKVDEATKSGEELLQKEVEMKEGAKEEVRRLQDVLAQKQLEFENLSLSNSDNGIALAAVANKKEELEKELIELKEGTAGLVENKQRIEEVESQKLVLEGELERIKTQYNETIAELESAALVAMEIQEKLSKENEILECNAKAQKSELSFALQKVEDLKKQLEAKDLEIEEVQKIQ